jgi:hypothetical protein
LYSFGAVSFSEDLSGFNAGIDLLLFRKELLATKDPDPGRMAQVSALLFILLGIALVLLNVKWRRGQRLAQIFALACMKPSLVWRFPLPLTS